MEYLDETLIHVYEVKTACRIQKKIALSQLLSYFPLITFFHTICIYAISS